MKIDIMAWSGRDMNSRESSLTRMRFVTTLGLVRQRFAVANAHLYLNVEASRRQLEAIINSTPDPVIVTDHRNRLLIANRAATTALGPGVDDTRSGIETEKAVKLKPLLNLLQSTMEEKQSTEIMLADKRTYLATASPVMVEGRADRAGVYA